MLKQLEARPMFWAGFGAATFLLGFFGPSMLDSAIRAANYTANGATVLNLCSADPEDPDSEVKWRPTRVVMVGDCEDRVCDKSQQSQLCVGRLSPEEAREE